jgi:hypothetical protein
LNTLQGALEKFVCCKGGVAFWILTMLSTANAIGGWAAKLWPLCPTLTVTI